MACQLYTLVCAILRLWFVLSNLTKLIILKWTKWYGHLNISKYVPKFSNPSFINFVYSERMKMGQYFGSAFCRFCWRYMGSVLVCANIWKSNISSDNFDGRKEIHLGNNWTSVHKSSNSRPFRNCSLHVYPMQMFIMRKRRIIQCTLMSHSFSLHRYLGRQYCNQSQSMQ